MKQTQKRLFTIFPEVSWFWLYSSTGITLYMIAFFRAYLVTILKVLISGYVVSVYTMHYFYLAQLDTKVLLISHNFDGFISIISDSFKNTWDFSKYLCIGLDELYDTFVLQSVLLEVNKARTTFLEKVLYWIRKSNKWLHS